MARLFGIAHRLMAVNLICFPLMLPVISWFYLLVNSYVHASLNLGMVDVLPGVGYFAGLLLRLPIPVFYMLLFLSAIVSGPLILGIHAVTGRIVMGRHVWVSESFSEALWNARQGVVLGLCVVIGGHLALWNVFGGLWSTVVWIDVLLSASRLLSVLLFLLFGISFPFVCQVAVSMDQPLWVVVKNGVILARVHLARGIPLFAAWVAYGWVTIVLVPWLSLFALPLVSVAPWALVQAAVSRPVIERYLVGPRRRTRDDNAA